jgi:glucose-6-phosphate dehydrogenase assembly protein OpcA
MAGLLDRTSIAISDFALARQSRWREAIASIFDDPDFLPYLRYIRRTRARAPAPARRARPTW